MTGRFICFQIKNKYPMPLIHCFNRLIAWFHNIHPAFGQGDFRLEICRDAAIDKNAGKVIYAPRLACRQSADVQNAVAHPSP